MAVIVTRHCHSLATRMCCIAPSWLGGPSLAQPSHAPLIAAANSSGSGPASASSASRFSVSC